MTKKTNNRDEPENRKLEYLEELKQQDLLEIECIHNFLRLHYIKSEDFEKKQFIAISAISRTILKDEVLLNKPFSVGDLYRLHLLQKQYWVFRRICG